MNDDFPVIFTENLTKSYEKGSIKALDGVNLVIERGDFVSIIGPSGSGKSTLLNMLGGLDKPTSGTVIIDGVDITKEKDLSEGKTGDSEEEESEAESDDQAESPEETK